jgi:ATP-dependent DNA helicase RecG
MSQDERTVVMTYTDQDLEQMLADVESDLAERKETFKGDAPTTVRETVCAFANDLPDHRRPGVVFIGARDDGTPSGLVVTDKLLLQLADIKTDGNILPPPSLNVEKRLLLGAEMAVITVLPADSTPVRYRGRICIRIGPRRGIASAQDERILNEKRRYRDRPFDVQPVMSAMLKDLDQVRFESEYLLAAVPLDVLEANDRNSAQRLAATKMIVSVDSPIPTVLGLLVIGKTTRSFLAGAYVQFLRIEGTELDQPIVDEELIDGTVADVVRKLEEKLVAHNRTRVDFTSGPLEQRAPLYPLVALQQLARNAILHRTYEGTNAPVRVYWYDDRIEILSPGGPYGEVTPENFGTPGLTDYRNPNLAEAMRVLGYVQKFGGGIAAARNALQRNGNPPPEFRVDQGYVLAVVRPTP